MRNLLYIVVSLIVLSSCGTVKYIHDVKEVEVPIVQTKIEYRDRIVYDSLYVKDSIYVRVTPDTVYKYVEKTNTRYIYKKDTIVVNDTIQIPVSITETITETKEVNVLHWWQKVLVTIGAGFIIAILIILGFKISKLFI